MRFKRSDLKSKDNVFQSLDKDGKIIDVSDGWLNKFGYSRKDVIGNFFGTFLDDKSLPQAQKNFPHLKDYGFVNNVPLFMKMKNGTMAEAVLNGISEYDKDGEFQSTICEIRTLHDILHSEQEIKEMLDHERFLRNFLNLKANVLQLMHNEDNLKLFLNHIIHVLMEPLDIKAVYIADGKTMYGNPNKIVIEVMNNLHNVLKKESFFFETKEGSSSEEILQLMQKADVLGICGKTISLKDHNMHIIFFLNKIELKDEWKNSLKQIISLFNYAIKSIINKEEKEAKEKEVKDYLDIAQVLIMALDNNKKVIMINQKGADILGYKKEDIIGKNFIENFIPEDIKQNISKISDEIIQEKDFHFEYENYILTKKGEERLILWKNSKLLDDKDNTIGILTSGEDITDKRIDEKRFLAQSKLAQMGEMLSMIAHQWRQPLSVISMGANNILMDIEFDSMDKKSLKNEIKNIENTTQELSKTIDDFRNFYKPNKQFVITKLENIIKKSLGIIKQSLIHNNINIVEVYDWNEDIELYDSEVMHVILNILGNAQDSFKDKEIKNKEITILIKNRTISINDNAGGIPEDIIDKIFDPYFSTKNEKNGTGLGLYMSKIIIEEHHHGKLSVKNIDDGVCCKIEFGIVSEK